MEQIFQVGGALLILSAFIAAQLRVLETSDTSYLLLNLVGSAILAVVAAVDRDWGFLLLEGVWAAVSAWGLIGRLRAAPTVANGP